MAAPPQKKPSPPKPSAGSSAENDTEFVPYVSDRQNIPELTWMPVIVGVILGIVFGASSLYLGLKVGMTVSASIPVAVLSITVFRLFSKVFRVRQATILENNIVQTTGSAGESISFGVAVTMPALMLLGFDMSLVRVTTVAVLGGLLGILMMIPLRRAFIVRQHGKLPYPEGTACAEVLIAGEKGGATALTVFCGFGLAFIHKFCMKAVGLWHETISQPLITEGGVGLQRAVIGSELTPELLGVGYIIGPRIGATMVGGAVLSWLVLAPMIFLFGYSSDRPLAPSETMLIRDMDLSTLNNNYLIYIAAGAVVTGGILSMFQALPLILSSLRGAIRDLAAAKSESTKSENRARLPRTQRDLPMSFVVLGSLGLIVALAATPSLGLGFGTRGILAACLIVAFGFLFVTVSSRLTGEIGSSSNPISGMTVATLLLTCLIFVYMGHTDAAAMLTALTIAGVVCIAASNGGTTSQDLKTGYIVGATPSSQQLAILVGALTSALVIGVTLLRLNDVGTIYSRAQENLPPYQVQSANQLPERERAGGQYAESDTNLYFVWHAGEGQFPGVPQGKYLVDESGRICYLVDPGINGRLTHLDDETPMDDKFRAPKTKLMALVIEGIFHGKLPWQYVLLGALIAVVLELAGVPALPFAVGMYLPIQISVTIFIGGLLRWCVDKIRKQSATDADSSPGVLMSSGYIAGGSIAGVILAFLTFAPKEFNAGLKLGSHLPQGWHDSNWPAIGAFSILVLALFFFGWGKLSSGGKPETERED
jgi:putative OPT family oligopeptide transporter